ncbi:MAG TPA: hypothetical protein VLW84_13860 [Terriglobales bacterium]|nr:hypothetical protein [Terriglobales bacterium]
METASTRSLPGRLAGLGLVALASTLFFAQWHYGFNWSDEGLLWYGSQRTVHGEVPLRDFFSYDPGRYYWSALVFKGFGHDGLFEQIIANDLFAVLGLLACYVAMSRAGIHWAWRAAILFMLAVMFGFPRHKIYEQSLSLFAAVGITSLLSDKASTKNWLIFGVLTGIAAFIGRNSGLYFAIAAILALILFKLAGGAIPRLRLLTWFVAGVFIGYSPMLFMMAGVKGFAAAFFQSLAIPNPQIPLTIPFPWHRNAIGLHGVDLLQVTAVSLLCAIVPLTYGYFILKWWTSKPPRFAGAYRLACGASIAGLPYLHHAFSRADFFHIAEAILPFALAIGSFAAYLWDLNKRRLSAAFFFVPVALILAAWLPREPMISYARLKAKNPASLESIEISGKNFEVPAFQAQIMRVVQAEFESCKCTDGNFLAMPHYPGLYAFLNTRAPFWEIYYLFARDSEFQARHIDALIKNGTSLVLLNPRASADGLDRLRIGHTYPLLLAYIQSHFQRMETVTLPDDFELYYLPGKCPEK